MPKRRSEPRASTVNRQDPEPRKAARLTCSNCRFRKIRCDGAQPTCGICIAYDESCQYDRPPPMTQIRAMADRIAQLEKTINNLQKDKITCIHDMTTEVGSDVSTTDAGSSRPVPSEILPPIDPVDGTHTYYDTTSAVHYPSDPLAQWDSERVSTVETVGNCQALYTNTLDPAELKSWEDKAVQNAAVYLHLSQDVIRRLFATHWTWVHANFMFVPRAVFLLDAAVGGKYFSPLLLAVLCLHSTRFRDHHLAEPLLARVKLLLSHEIHNEGSIPLVQALLQFSAREIGRGSVSQAWLYGGMAFRVAIDIGLFSSSPCELAKTEDIKKTQLGRHLAWSCFLWDKTLSLYLGRTPSLPEPPKWDPALPETPEIEMWPPYSFAEDESFEYTPQPSHLLLCFAYNCKIGVIINDILLNIYGGRTTRDASDFIQATRGKLQLWRSNLPAALHVDRAAQNCPPTHIVAQHMLYHATVILLHRPFFGNATCWKACQEAAEGIQLLLQLLERSFGLVRFTYVMAYCTYTAATVVVQDMKDGRPGMLERVDTFIRALNAIRTSCPGIQRSIEILTRGLNLNENAVSIQTSLHLNHEAIQDASPPVQNQFPQIPAFPYHDFRYGFTGITDRFSPNPVSSSNPFFDLNSYPQLWFDDFSDGVLNDFNS